MLPKYPSSQQIDDASKLLTKKAVLLMLVNKRDGEQSPVS